MPYFNTCPYCGSNLDPGEPCDCKGEIQQELAAAAEDKEPEAGSEMARAS